MGFYFSKNARYFVLLQLYSKNKHKTDMTTRRLYRSNDQMIAGVCAGIAEYFGWDKGVVRLVYLILSVFSAGFPGILVYIVLWIVMPEDRGRGTIYL